MPARVHIPHRIIRGVAVPVQGLRVARVGHDGVRLDEAPERGVVVAGVVKVQAAGQFARRCTHAFVQARARQAAGGVGSLGRALWGWKGAGGSRIGIED